MWQIYQNSKPTEWKETYETEKTGQIQRNGKNFKMEGNQRCRENQSWQNERTGIEPGVK